MKLFDIRSISAALIFACVAGIPSFVWVHEEPGPFLLELSMTADSGGFSQVFYDDGRGYREELSSRLPVANTTEFQQYKFPIPAGTFYSFRFDPINRNGRVSVSNPRITDKAGNLVRELGLSELHPGHHVTSAEQSDGVLKIFAAQHQPDPQIIIRFENPLELHLPPSKAWFSYFRTAVVVFFLIVAALYLVGRFANSSFRHDRVQPWFEANPKTVIALAAFVSAIVSTYPVVFFGKSFVSPNYIDGTYLLYEDFPTLPGYNDENTEYASGSDVGAIAWHHHPLSIIEHRALFRDGELPLWNRYDQTGAVLLGQGQSMFGDPLHLLPILTNGAAWAWDVKYVLAKWLFACGLGLLVLRCTRHMPSALLTAATGTFIGFFVYRVNHPAIFSLCYSPWILYAWLILLDATGVRARARAALALVLANWMVVTSGTAKEAYMLVLGLNFTGCLVVATSEVAWRRRFFTVASAAGAGVLLILASSPIWVTFYDALSTGFSVYDTPHAFQIDPSFLIGAFDEVFYRCLQHSEQVFNPSANFLVLLGVLMLLATFRHTPFDRLKVVLSLATLVPFAFAFGLAPPEWIIRLPFIANISHVDNTFSCVLIVHMMVLAGFGYKFAFERLGTKSGFGDILTSAFLLGLLLTLWIAVVHTIHRPTFGTGSVYAFLTWGEHLPVSDFAWGSLIILPTALIGLLLTVHLLKQDSRWTVAGTIFALLCLSILLWRHGQHLKSGFATYVYNPPVRVDFHAESPAIRYAQSTSTEPYRIVGLDGNLTPGWSAVYDLETVAGPEAVVNGHFRDIIMGTGLMDTWEWRLRVAVDSLPSKLKVYDFFNVRYFLKSTSLEESLPGGLTRGLKGDLDVFESNTVWPRAFFTDRLATYAYVPQFADLILSGDGKPFAAGQVSDVASLPALSPQLEDRMVLPAQDYRLTVNSTSFVVATPKRGIIVLQEAWLADAFDVRVNGKPTNYFRVNHAFKGIEVPEAGTYHVSFSYWPPFFTICLALSGVAFVAIAALVWVGWRFPEKNQPGLHQSGFDRFPSHRHDLPAPR